MRGSLLMLDLLALKLGVELEQFFQPTRGRRNAITYSTLFEILCSTPSLKEASKKLNCSERTLTRWLSTSFTKNDSKQAWNTWILDIIDHKKCSQCGLILKASKFSANRAGLQFSCKQCNKEYRDQNKEKIKKYRKEYYCNNKSLFRAHSAKRRAAELKRTIFPWQQEEIIDFYRKCPAGFHVDHIIPLQGKLVSGLHVLSNLQYLPASENLKKSNSFDIEGFNA